MPNIGSFSPLVEFFSSTIECATTMNSRDSFALANFITLVYLITVVHGNGLQLEPGPCPAPTPLADFHLTNFTEEAWYVLRMPRGFYSCSSCTPPVFNLSFEQPTIRRSNTANEWLSLVLEWPSCPEEWSTPWNLHLIANPGLPGSFQIKLPWPLNSLGQARLTVIATDYEYYAAVVACWGFPFESIALPFLLSKDDSFYIDPILESRVQRLLLNQRLNAYDWESYPHSNCPTFNSIPQEPSSLQHSLVSNLTNITTPSLVTTSPVGPGTSPSSSNSSSTTATSLSSNTPLTRNTASQLGTTATLASQATASPTTTVPDASTDDSVQFSDDTDTAAYTNYYGYTTLAPDDPKGDAEWITTTGRPLFNVYPSFNPGFNPGRPSFPRFPGAGGPEFPPFQYYPPGFFPTPWFPPPPPQGPGFGRKDIDETNGSDDDAEGNVEAEVTGEDFYMAEAKTGAESDPRSLVGLYPLPPDPFHGKLAHLLHDNK